tara:strand:+ start:273 stop:809 length:537 start_codon:yes stop_codon:yes gene_type:complete
MIRQYANVLSADLCDWLIDTFNESEHAHKHQQTKVMDFVEYNFTENKSNLMGGEEKHQEVAKALKKALRDYMAEMKVTIFPEVGGVEAFRVKRYLKNSSQDFKLHIDCANKASSQRFLAFLFYLNNSDGETEFTRQGLKATPIQGSVLIFPPTWEYPHIGHPTKDNDKYIMSTYLHYG